MLTSPSRFSVLVLVVYAAGYYVAPIEPALRVAPYGVTLWLVCAIALTTGLALGERRATERQYFQSSDHSQEFGVINLVRYGVPLGISGVLLLFVDRYIVRGAPLDFDIMATRAAVEQSPPGIFGVVAAFFGAFAPFTWLCCRIVEHQFGYGSVPGRIQIAAGLCAICYVALSLAMGSRSVLVAVVIIHATVLLHLNSFNPSDRRKTLLRVALALVATLVLSIFVMLARLNEMEFDPLLSVQISVYSDSLLLKSWVYSAIITYPELASALAAAVSIGLYLYHAIFEFTILVEKFGGEYTAGRQLLWLPLKLVDIVLGTRLSADLSALEGVKVGVFTTLFGPLYVDFGLFAPIVCLLLGLVLALPARGVQSGCMSWILAAGVCAATLALFPVFSMIDSSAGLYLLVAAVVLGYIGRNQKGDSNRRDLRTLS